MNLIAILTTTREAISLLPSLGEVSSLLSLGALSLPSSLGAKSLLPFLKAFFLAGALSLLPSLGALSRLPSVEALSLLPSLAAISSPCQLGQCSDYSWSFTCLARFGLDISVQHVQYLAFTAGGLAWGWGGSSPLHCLLCLNFDTSHLDLLHFLLFESSVSLPV